MTCPTTGGRVPGASLFPGACSTRPQGWLAQRNPTSAAAETSQERIIFSIEMEASR